MSSRSPKGILTLLCWQGCIYWSMVDYIETSSDHQNQCLGSSTGRSVIVFYHSESKTLGHHLQ
uniref:Uncharacterized protein n=1 Tax=Brassica oleracea var. oleracea TaxID=109376 RepID=A0A0D3B2L6_BRAOL